MSKLDNNVREFRKLFGLTFGDTPAIREPELQSRMLLEETFETVVALVGHAVAMEMIMVMAMRLGRAPADGPSLPEVADGLLDLQYIAQGCAQACGIDLDPVLDAVHAANMAKVGGPVVNGKQLKPPGWTPPDIASVLRAQEWNGR